MSYKLSITIHKFLTNSQISQIFCASSQITSTDVKITWDETEEVIDTVYLHVCKHTNYFDMKILLEKNDIWSDNWKEVDPAFLESPGGFGSVAERYTTGEDYFINHCPWGLQLALNSGYVDPTGQWKEEKHTQKVMEFMPLSPWEVRHWRGSQDV